jgi:hypothetical protein
MKKQNGKPGLICAVDDISKPTHYVEIRNVKTYSREVKVKGVITSTSKKAEFIGSSSICTESSWEMSGTVHNISGTDVLTFDSVQINKKTVGEATICVEVQYEDVWNPGTMLAADLSRHPLVFKVDLV